LTGSDVLEEPNGLYLLRLCVDIIWWISQKFENNLSIRVIRGPIVYGVQKVHGAPFLEHFYYYKEMGVHVLDAIIRDWLEAPPPNTLSLEGPRRTADFRGKLSFTLCFLSH